MNVASDLSRMLLIIPLLTGCLPAADVGKPPSAPLRAGIDIDGSTFSVDDVQRKNPGALFQARNALYEAERRAADEFIDDYLLDREARNEKLTVQEFLQRRVYSTLKDPSEEALRVYYEGLNTTGSYEAVRDKILDAIRQRRMAKMKTAYVQSLRSRANVAVRLAPPRLQLAAADNAPARGASAAAVTLIEYADYECPYCQQIQPALARLEAEYKGKLVFAYKDVPLPMHANAQKAAEAAHCAGAQGKYWEYHDLLFASKQYELPRLKEHARALNLDGQAFDWCLDSGAQAERIKASVAEAQAFGLPGTPGFFVNGRFINGAADYQTLRRVIEEELAAAASSVARNATGVDQPTRSQ
jgi:protein-disulfide isomerase